MRPLTTQQSYDLFEIIEARTKHGATIFCTQYDPYSDWYERLNTDPSQDSPISDAIMDRIYHNSYVVSVEGAERRGGRTKRYLVNEMKRYLTLVPDASEEELSELKEWVTAGNSPYSNPWYIADERGTELPFIQARREIFSLEDDID